MAEGRRTQKKVRRVKKRAKINMLWVIIALAVILIVVLGILLIGPSSEKPSTSFSDIVGNWTLDCKYIDAKPVEIGESTMSITKNEMVVTSKVQAPFTPPEGATDEEIASLKAQYDENPTFVDEDATYSVSSGNGKFSISKGGKTIEYEFSYEKRPKVLHLYYHQKDLIVHEIYKKS